jgi:hypothetical protein
MAVESCINRYVLLNGLVGKLSFVILESSIKLFSAFEHHLVEQKLVCVEKSCKFSPYIK